MFELLTKDSKQEGAAFCIKNANKLYANAERLAVSKDFGLSTSLMVLSTEEAIKALALFESSICKEFFDNKNLEEYFRSHRTKQTKASYFMVILFIISKTKDILDTDEKDNSITKEKKVRSFLDELMACLSSIDDYSELNAIGDWSSSADNIKQDGLYVKWDQGGWRSPCDITEETYILMKDKAKKVIDNIELIMNNLSAEETEQFIAQYKEKYSASKSIDRKS